MYTLKQITPIIHGTQKGQDVKFTGVSTDSRTINPGELFVALIGENFNGHDFIQAAADRGAIAALVSQPTDILPSIEVKDTLTALGQVAAWHRSHFDIPVIGLTGSCGKTTVKTMIGNILQQVAPTLISTGNLNNAIGLPLSLLKLTAEHQYAVLEMGANHIGEIAYLTELARPTIGLITCVRPVHVAGFGGITQIAQAKSEIYQNLPENGIAIINHDEPYAQEWHALLKTQSVITFGLQGGMVTARDIHADENGHMHFKLEVANEHLPISLQLLGEHNVLNALAAAAVAWVMGISLEAIQSGLAHMQPVKGRLVQRRAYQGALLLDDHYNSNPSALEAALMILARFPDPKILVMGDMLELGPTAEEQHRAMAQIAKRAGVAHVFGYGALTKGTVEVFGEGAQHFATHAELAEALRPLLTENTTVLVKGSRGMKLEKVVELLMEKEKTCSIG
jgi:UDP-N-acetylmuramoyl-tripeptide--D-alanyl-D-alanine ligase